MDIYKQYTTYNMDGTIKNDIDFNLCKKYKNILIIATREAQINRITDFIYNKASPKSRANKVFTFSGWWELEEFSLTRNKNICVSEWKKFDCIFFLDATRASNQKYYNSLIEKVVQRCHGQFLFVQ